MKKIIFLLIVIMIVIAGVFVFRAKKSLPGSSVYDKVNEGIKHSRLKNYPESIVSFEEALHVLDKNGFFFSGYDIAEFSSLINEFKTENKMLKPLFESFNKDFQLKISELKTSKEITEELKQALYAELNLLIKQKDFLKNILKQGDKQIALEPRVQNILKKIQNDDISNQRKNSLILYLNRVYLNQLFPDYFRKPFSKSQINLNIAISLGRQKKYQESVALLNKIIATDEFYLKAYILLARAYEKIDRMDDALAVLKKGLLRFPDNELILTETAYYYGKKGEEQKARGLIDQALLLKPSFKYAVSLKKNIERKDKIKLKSSDEYYSLIKNGDSSVFSLSNYILALRKERNITKIEKPILDGIKRFPNDSFFLKMKGWLEGTKKNYREAVSLLLKAKKIASKQDAEIFLFLGITYFNQNLENEAIVELQEGLELFPDDLAILLNLASICEMTSSNTELAIKYYEKFLKINQDDHFKTKIEKKLTKLKK